MSSTISILLLAVTAVQWVLNSTVYEYHSGQQRSDIALEVSTTTGALTDMQTAFMLSSYFALLVTLCLQYKTMTEDREMGINLVWSGSSPMSLHLDTVLACFNV